ncbi:MAG: sigma-70 family RNA polymerase sigma factor [Elusimicrobiota bacterium]|nr:sigma-70 family RNA polymerase sigma factor [Elusimicrobiota bacterium]
MNYTQYTDEEIVKKLQSTEISLQEKNFLIELLVNKYKDQLLSFIYNFGKNRITLQDAEEIVIETFLKFFNNIKNFKFKSSVETYIYRIAINLTKNFLKSKHLRNVKRLNIVPIEELEKDIPHNENLENIIIYEDSQQEIKNLVLNLINRLPEKQKLVLHLAVYEKMSYKQIATILNTTVSSVESLLFRAKQNIRKFIIQDKGLAKKFNIEL